MKTMDPGSSGGNSRAMARLLRPRSIAVVGASPTPGSIGGSVLSNLERFGFAHAIYPVNPKHERIGKWPCVRSIPELPDGVDCVVLAIAQAHIVDAVRSCAQKDVGGIIVLAGGFAETGEEGKRAQAEIANIARAAGMALQGPNCLGTTNFVDSVAMMFGSASPDPLGDRPGVAVVSQSGAMAAVIRVALQARGIGISYSVSTGNEAVLGAEDFLEEFSADPHTRVLAMLLEQVRQPARFLELADRARAAGKSLVLQLLGRSDAGRAAALTHTGALSGDYAVMATHLAARGICLVDSLEALIDVPELLIRFNGQRPPSGTAIVTESGAFKGMSLDFCEAAGLALPPLPPAVHDRLAKELPPFAPPSNPFDLTAQALVDPGLYGRVLAELAEDSTYGSIAIAITLPSADSANRKLPPIIDALRALDRRKPVVFAMLGEDCPVPLEHVAAIRATGTPFFRSPERAFRALAALAAIPSTPGAAGRATQKPAGFAPVAEKLPPGTMPEYRAKALLATRGIIVPASHLARTAAEAVAAAMKLGFPVALKAQAAALPHKSDVGGVELRLESEEAVRIAWSRINEKLARARPELTLDGILVERMSEQGIELIVGARNEGDWGPVILIGLGGIFAELLKDVALVPAGASRDEILRAVHSLKGRKMLEGYRGTPPADINAVVDVVAALGALLLEHREIAEVDLNPVRVHAQGRGVTVLDALLVVR